nr:alpha/beta hydrolase [Frigoribacterium sp. CG_9.8]
MIGTYRLITPDQRGRGRTRDMPGPISHEIMAEDYISLLDEQLGEPVHLLGYSDGAVVALFVALKRPDLVTDPVVVSGVYHRDGWAPGVLDTEVPEFMIDSYAEVSPDGRAHFTVVAVKLTQMRSTQPAITERELADVSCPTLVLIGDDDEVLLEHAVSFYRALPQGELAVVPHASHGVLVEKPELCSSMITAFHGSDKPATYAPIQRAN